MYESCITHIPSGKHARNTRDIGATGEKKKKKLVGLTDSCIYQECVYPNIPREINGQMICPIYMLFSHSPANQMPRRSTLLCLWPITCLGNLLRYFSSFLWPIIRLGSFPSSFRWSIVRFAYFSPLPFLWLSLANRTHHR